jgi:photosystem II stability/assembly factor-like uncharacterized protein
LLLSLFSRPDEPKRAPTATSSSSKPPRSKAQRWFDAFRAFPGDTFDATFVQQYRNPGASKNRKLAAVDGSIGAWTFIGPRNLIHENLYGSPVSAGRVNAVLAVNNQTIFAAADRGGVWKSMDGGETWRPLTDHLPFPSITSLVSDGQFVYAGTGHGVVLRSADGGESWDSLVVPGAVKIASLAIGADGSLVAGVESVGILRSKDSGASWTTVASLPRTIPMVNMINGRLWATASQWDSPIVHQGLYRSGDNGATWTRHALPFTASGQRTIRIAGSGSTVYLMASSTARLEGLYRSTDSGDTWETVRPRFPEMVCATINGPCPPMEALAVHPLHPDTIYLGRVWLYRSLNGGASFDDINKSAAGVVPHVDHRGLAFAPDGSTLYDANDGGIWAAPDDGATRTVPDWRSLSADLGITQFYPGISLHPDDANQVLAGTQDNSFVLWRDGVWRCGFTGDFMWTQIDPRNPNTAFAVLYPGREMVVRTKNDWKDFAFLANGIDTERAPWVSPLEMDPDNPNRLYFGTVRVFKTDNQGDRWQTISEELGPITALAVAAGDSNRVYAAANSRVYAYRGGTSWDVVSVPAMPGRNVSRILASGSELFVTYSGLRAQDQKGHVYYSPDGGGTWIDRTSGLPDAPVNDLIYDPDQEGVLYAATDLGVYRSRNLGIDWEQIGSGLPMTTVSSIRLHRKARILRAATYGRGIWDLTVPVAR